MLCPANPFRSVDKIDKTRVRDDKNKSMTKTIAAINLADAIIRQRDALATWTNESDPVRYRRLMEDVEQAVAGYRKCDKEEVVEVHNQPPNPFYDEDWFNLFDLAHEKYADDARQILAESVEGKTIKAFGFTLFPHDHFEDLEAFMQSTIILARDFNVARDELFSVCREVLPKIGATA